MKRHILRGRDRLPIIYLCEADDPAAEEKVCQLHDDALPRYRVGDAVEVLGVPAHVVGIYDPADYPSEFKACVACSTHAYKIYGFIS